VDRRREVVLHVLAKVVDRTVGAPGRDPADAVRDMLPLSQPVGPRSAPAAVEQRLRGSGGRAGAGSSGGASDGELALRR
jgi:hypothetical protein